MPPELMGSQGETGNGGRSQESGGKSLPQWADPYSVHSFIYSHPIHSLGGTALVPHLRG